MKTAKYEKFYKELMTFEEYELRAMNIANKVKYSTMMNRLTDNDYATLMQKIESFGDSILAKFLDIVNLTTMNNENDVSLEGIIAYEIAKTSEESFKRFGDKNCLTSAIKKHYISKDKDKVWTLDIQAKNMSDQYHKDITPQDLIDFILNYPNGSHTYKNKFEIEKEELMEDFCKLTGLPPLTKNFIMRFATKSIDGQKEKVVDGIEYIEDVPF